MTLKEPLNITFKDQSLLTLALTHRSFFNENREEAKGHNERLEFLGDSVIDLALSHLLLKRFPNFTEGHLSKLRAGLVNEGVLAGFAEQYGLSEHLHLGRGEAQSGGARKPRLLASAFEAYVGAVFLDSSYDQARILIEKVFEPLLADVEDSKVSDWDYKTRLQELMQEKEHVTPIYQVTSESGPDHQKEFVVTVQVGDQILGQGGGRSKKQAEQRAAQVALRGLQ